jgi:hypothetical protein
MALPRGAYLHYPGPLSGKSLQIKQMLEGSEVMRDRKSLLSENSDSPSTPMI